jgi:hypothetical protein
MNKNMLVDLYEMIDKNIEASHFDDDWCQAKKTITHEKLNVAEKKIDVRMLRPAFMMIFILAVSVLFISMTGQTPYVEEVKPENTVMQESQVILPINPNQPWYAPTDQLLQVSALNYQNQWVTFTEYNPITMEIR